MALRRRARPIIMALLAGAIAAGCPSAEESPDRSAPAGPSSERTPKADAAEVRTTPVHMRANPMPPRVDGPAIVVLGVAQDAGVPQAGCDCTTCRAAAADPAASPRVASLALVLGDGRVFMVDATPDLPLQLRDIAALRGEASGSRSRKPVAGILLTHGHMGHYLGLAHLGFEAAHTDRIPVYGTRSMMTLLRDHAPWSQLVAKHEIELTPLSADTPVVLGDVRVIPVAVPHRAEFTDTVGYRFEGPAHTVLYVPDCDPWSRWEPGAQRALLHDVDVALLDGTFHSGDELPGRDLTAIGHPLIVDTMDMLGEQPRPATVRFIHLNHSNPALDPDGDVRRAIVSRGFGVATRGDTYDL